MWSKPIPEVFQPPVASGTILLRISGSLAPRFLLQVTHLPKAGVVFYPVKVLETKTLFEHNDAACAILLADFRNCLAIHISPSLHQPTAQSSLNPTLTAACLQFWETQGRENPTVGTFGLRKRKSE